MKILDPITMVDAQLTRASTATYYDVAGVLQTAANDVARINYDPSNLALAPRLLLESSGTNIVLYSEQMDNAAWQKVNVSITANSITSPSGTLTADKVTGIAGSSLKALLPSAENAITPGAVYTLSAWINAGTSQYLSVVLDDSFSTHGVWTTFDLVAGTVTQAATAYGDATKQASTIVSIANGFYKITLTGTAGTASTGARLLFSLQPTGTSFLANYDTTAYFYIWGIQCEQTSKATSYVPTTTVPVTRAADIYTNTSGTFLASSVPENDYTEYSASTIYATGDFVRVTADHKVYAALLGSLSAVTMTIATPCVVTWTAHGLAANTAIQFSTTGALPTGLVAGTTYYVLTPATNTFNVSATPAGAAINTTGSQSGVHTARAGANLGKTPNASPTYWLDSGPTNRWNMFDQVNNTQSTQANYLDVHVRSTGVATGVFLGDIEGDSVDIVVTDAVEGIVYSVTKSLIVSNSYSSFWNWCFKKIAYRTAVVSAVLPAYAGAIISIRINNPGDTAKCGMCVIGPVVDVGLSQYGLAAGIKDYSSNTFNPDGSNETVLRNYAKSGTVDVTLLNDVVDAVTNDLLNYRQKNVVWISTEIFETGVIFGKFSSFKTIIQDYSTSKLALQIDGAI